MAVNLSESGIVQNIVYTKSFGLSCEVAQDEDDWRLRVKGQLADPGLSG